MSAIRNRSDLLLALLYAGNEEPTKPEPVAGITRLEKLLFLLSKEKRFLSDVEERDSFHFVPFRMGPWTGEVYDEVDFLECLGLVESRGEGKESAADASHDDELFAAAVLDRYEKQTAVDDDRMQVFDLTERGREKACTIWQRLSPDERRKIVSVKQRYNTMNLSQFLRYVYKTYPDYTTKSEIKDALGL